MFSTMFTRQPHCEKCVNREGRFIKPYDCGCHGYCHQLCDLHTIFPRAVGVWKATFALGSEDLQLCNKCISYIQHKKADPCPCCTSCLVVCDRHWKAKKDSLLEAERERKRKASKDKERALPRDQKEERESGGNYTTFLPSLTPITTHYPICKQNAKSCGCCLCTICDIHKYYPQAEKGSKNEWEPWYLIKELGDWNPCKKCKILLPGEYTIRCTCCENCLRFYGGWWHWLQVRKKMVTAGLRTPDPDWA